MFVYVIPPIDLWEAWLPEKEFRAKIEDGGLESEFDEFRKDALRVALALGWEGDFREGPYVTALIHPQFCGATLEYVLAWKQDNNGTTYLASPRKLALDQSGDEGRLSLGRISTLQDKVACLSSV